MSTLTWESVAHRPRNAPPLVMAHRGASDDLPENTLAAFRLALEQGAQVLETDLRFTRDDEIVLMHDATLDRTTDGSGAVSEMTLAEIKKVHAKPSPSTASLDHARDSARDDGAVPTLEELLQFLRESPQITSGETPLALELKDDRFQNPRDAQRLIDLLAKYNALASSALVSFHLSRLSPFKKLEPQIPIGLISLANPFPLFNTEFLGPFYPLLYLNPLYVWWARRLGKIVCPLDPAPEPRLGYYRALGVAVVLTNHPAKTVHALDLV